MVGSLILISRVGLQRCWAHLLREAEWLAEHCEEAKSLYLALKRLYADLAACLVGDPPLLQFAKSLVLSSEKASSVLVREGL